ncbi:hypothetical protein ACRAKI_16370 [Saccharothrix isguenensis]
MVKWLWGRRPVTRLWSWLSAKWLPDVLWAKWLPGWLSATRLPGWERGERLRVWGWLSASWARRVRLPGWERVECGPGVKPGREVSGERGVWAWGCWWWHGGRL